jgi:hypothetical protein
MKAKEIIIDAILFIIGNAMLFILRKKTKQTKK